ncbi:MAG: HAMP domain-containing sensor histidine kinase [Owenweeksia sp.]
MQMKTIKSKKGVRWLIALMTLSLVGITGIQAYWISNAYGIKEEKFDQQVSEALFNTSKRLEALENVNFLYDSFRLEPFFSSKVQSNIGFFNGEDSLNRKIKRDSRYQVSMRINGDTVLMLNSDSDSSQLRVIGSLGGDSNPGIMLKRLPVQIQKKARNLDVMFEKMILHEVRKGSHLEARLTSEDLDSILNFELQTRGIDLPYQYSVVENNRLVMKSKGWKPEQEQHRALLFPNDFFGNHLMMVSFPGKTNYLLSSMWAMLLISMIFTVAMIVTFSKTLSYSIRQKRISEIKTDFINNMTHEFKTPIATINLAIDAMSNAKMINNPEKVLHYSQVIKQENQRMNMQVESVLRMALMDKKELELSYERLDITELLHECAAHIRLQLESRGGKLQKFFNAPALQLEIDRNHLGNAVINILDNAMKYSLGAPEITMITEATKSHFIVIISDKGMGMTKDEQKRIFDRFFRVSSGNIHNIKGHGLGLSYAQGIIEAHRGRIEVESEKGKGSKFYIYLPLSTTN